MAAEPMSEERLAGLEHGRILVTVNVVEELVAEVRREWASNLVTDEQIRKGAERIAELETEVERLRLTREQPHSARLASRIFNAEDRVRELEAELVAVRASVDRVRALHAPKDVQRRALCEACTEEVRGEAHVPTKGCQLCTYQTVQECSHCAGRFGSCDEGYPCPTVRYLDGEATDV